METQRFPEDYEGVLAGAPANDWVHLMTVMLGLTKATALDPATYISSLKLPAIQRAALEHLCVKAVYKKRDLLLGDVNCCVHG